MAIALAIFGVAFAALCVWLGVRIVNRRERWAKWTLATVVGLPVMYVLSIGPAAWILHGLGEPQWAATIYMRLYGPINWAYRQGPQVTRIVMDWYTNLL